MKSFSDDEGYQAPCSPGLIEQESYIANYVVCIPLVSTVLSEGVHSAAVQKEKSQSEWIIHPFCHVTLTHLAPWGFLFELFFWSTPAVTTRVTWKRHWHLTWWGLMPQRKGKKKKASTSATLPLNKVLPQPSGPFFVHRIRTAVQLWAITALCCNYCQPPTTHCSVIEGPLMSLEWNACHVKTWEMRDRKLLLKYWSYSVHSHHCTYPISKGPHIGWHV